MYSRRILAEMHDEIEEQIQAMPNNYTSLEFYTSLARDHPQKYETLIRSYIGEGTTVHTRFRYCTPN